jgi:pimeloyl-ACP methyl ester carboxylesterase
VLLIGLVAMIRPDIPVEDLIPTYTDSTSTFIRIDGMDVHIRDEGSGPALLLIHGTFSSLHTWDVWTPVLAQTHRVIRLDLPGFGLTGPQPQGDYSTRATLHLIDSLRVALGIDTWTIGGNSLGGRIALDYARHYPTRTDALVLVDAAASFPRDTTQAAPAAPQSQERPFILRALANPVFRNAMSVLTPRFLFEHSLAGAYGDPSLMTDDIITRYYELLRRDGNRSAFISRADGSQSLATPNVVVTTRRPRFSGFCSSAALGNATGSKRKSATRASSFQLPHSRASPSFAPNR